MSGDRQGEAFTGGTKADILLFPTFGGMEARKAKCPRFFRLPPSAPPRSLRETTQPPRLPTTSWPNSIAIQAYITRLYSVRITFSCRRLRWRTSSVRHQPAAPRALSLRALPRMPTNPAFTPMDLRKCHTKFSLMAPHKTCPLCPLSRISTLRLAVRALAKKSLLKSTANCAALIFATVHWLFGNSIDCALYTHRDWYSRCALMQRQRDAHVQGRHIPPVSISRQMRKTPGGNFAQRHTGEVFPRHQVPFCWAARSSSLSSLIGRTSRYWLSAACVPSKS